MIPVSEMSVVALVPMRHHSQRVPGKNFRPIAGRPLYAYILETLSRCPEITKIVVDTDSPVLTEGIGEAFPAVEIIPRPAELCGDDVPMNEILLHDVQQVEGEVFLQTHSTNPLLRAETVSRAVQEYFEGLPEHDSLFSVTRFQTRLWTADGKPVNHDPATLIPTQDLEPLFLENSCVYVFSRTSVLEHGNRLGDHPRLFEIPAEEAIDIDTEWDITLAECMILDRERGT
jgi:CMP-N-acetylneuraminic acid synthetase